MVLSDRQVALLARHLHLVATWRRAAGLTAVSDPRQAARVHVADSLLCLKAEIPLRAIVIDVGSGAGFPGIPLAVVRPDLRIALLEAGRMKAGFLELAVRDLSLPVQVLMRRAEDAATDPEMRERADVVVARAVAPLPVLLEMAMPLAAVGGQLILLKGPRVQEEISGADRIARMLGGGAPMVIEATLAGGEARRVVVVRKATATPSRFPRRPGVARLRPI